MPRVAIHLEIVKANVQSRSFALEKEMPVGQTGVAKGQAKRGGAKREEGRNRVGYDLLAGSIWIHGGCQPSESAKVADSPAQYYETAGGWSVRFSEARYFGTCFFGLRIKVLSTLTNGVAIPVLSVKRVCRLFQMATVWFTSATER